MSDVSIAADSIMRKQLGRVLDPRTIPIVGADESSPLALSPLGTLDSDAKVFFVSQRSTTFFGHETFPSISDIGVPVDAVLSIMSAERTTTLAEEAAGLDTGGLITVAGGFAELGGDGSDLQNRLRAAAYRGNMPVIGPNGVGYINVPKKLDLTLLRHFDRRVGGVSLISHSGAVLEAIAASAWRAGGVGFNIMISAGNEPVTDMADYLDYLVDDPETKVICLVVEKIRRPEQFFAAAARARAGGKPIVAVKLARTERTQRMASSHTGTLTSDAWVYEQAFKQAGIILAGEVDELVDRVQFLEQLPQERWSEVNGLFVMTMTGGFAAMAADLADEEGVDIPDDEELAKWVGTLLPGTTVANPLDATGFAAFRHELFVELLEAYTQNTKFDAFVFFHQLAEWDTGADVITKIFADHCRKTGRPAVISPMAGHGGHWLDQIRIDSEVAVGNGLRGSLRGFNTMSTFVRSRSNARVESADSVALTAKPTSATVQSEAGEILSFESTMELFAQMGIPTARYQVIGSESVHDIPFDGPYVVKLADLAHRTEHGAVRVDVSNEDLAVTVTELQEFARREGLPTAIAVQQLVKGSGEAFIGVRSSTELGPVVAFGLGGVFVEVMRRVSGRLAPLSAEDAQELVSEFDDTGVLDGFRGSKAWDRLQLGEILVNVGVLAAASRMWVETIDINPLIQGADGFFAVDGLVVLKPGVA